MYTTKDFNYNLPDELIAQTPIEPRDASRLLHLQTDSGAVEHRVFRELVDILKEGDLLVVNNTKVIPARLFAYDESGRKFELMLLKRLNNTDWEALLKPAKKAKIGTQLVVNENLKCTINHIESNNGVRVVGFEFNGVFEDILNDVGTMPLPPYITKKLTDNNRYNTVYSKIEGSAAAPTAGLHFTPSLMDALRKKGVEFAEILLHVGLGTFRPVKCDNIKDHKMHSEYYEISQKAADAVNKAVAEGRRVIAVGTTSVRTLESSADENGFIKAEKSDTSIFLYPPYKFKTVRGLITNFHLPQSTLIMLVSAFIGREKTLEIYNLAVQEKYRFFSFGDAMLLL
jgi:S-adenosylmethionine:tRNA ribosyltransferase-isomerase